MTPDEASYDRAPHDDAVHEDRRVVAYLAGELSPSEAEVFEAHLVGCDGCWLAIGQDRRGQALAEGLRELAPAAVRDRIRMQGQAAPTAGPTRPTRPRRGRFAVAALAATCLCLAGLWATTIGGRSSDAATVAAVIDAAHDSWPPESVVADGQTVALVREVLDGREVTLGRSDAPFPMPAGGRHVDDNPSGPWVARRGPMTVVCISKPENLLLVADLPADRLISWAQDLRLAPLVPG